MVAWIIRGTVAYSHFVMRVTVGGRSGRRHARVSPPQSDPPPSPICHARAVEKNWLDDNWGMLLVRGIIAVLFGLAAMIWPGITAVALAVLWGIWALIEGVVDLVAAFQKGATGRGWKITFGVISIVAGLIAIIHPFDVAVVLTWILGIWFIVAAIFQGFGAFASTRTQPRWMLLISAVLSLVIGILFVAKPGVGVLSIVLWIGIVAIIWGIVLIIAAFSARRLGKEIDTAAPQAA